MKASPTRILLGLVLGVAVGYLCLKTRSPLLARIPGIVAPIGALFISAIQACVIPLVTSSLVVGCAASGRTDRIGRLAGKSLLLILGYLSISAIFAGGVAFPLFQRLHTWIQGNVLVVSKVAASVATPGGLGEWISGLVPYNIFKAAADGALLPLIVISIAFGITLAQCRRSGEMFYSHGLKS